MKLFRYICVSFPSGLRFLPVILLYECVHGEWYPESPLSYKNVISNMTHITIIYIYLTLICHLGQHGEHCWQFSHTCIREKKTYIGNNMHCNCTNINDRYIDRVKKENNSITLLSSDVILWYLFEWHGIPVLKCQKKRNLWRFNIY
jgi:hypothetical protein